jgi:MFS family permease
MLITGIALGLVLGLIAGGSLSNLTAIELRRTSLLVVAVLVRFGTEFLLGSGVAIVEAVRVPLYAASFALLLYALWANRRFPGMSLAFVGSLMNGIVILANAGYMPVWEPSLVAAGFTPADVSPALHIVLPPALDASFLLHLGPLADVLPIPVPVLNNVVSVGDFFITFGLGFFLFAGVLQVPQMLDEATIELDEGDLEVVRARLRDIAGETPGASVEGPGAADTGLSPSLAAAAALERPLILGGTSPGMASPALARLRGPAAAGFPPGSAGAVAWSSRRRIALGITTAYLGEPDGPSAAARAATVAAGVAAVTTTAAAALPGRPATAALGSSGTAAATVALEPRVGVRVRRHPYVRLALNGPFSAMWSGQLISLFGDRLNQLALVAVVLVTTGSAFASGLAFFVATLPNLLLSPIAGTFVDRWDHKDTMVVSDILRAVLVLLVPVAATINIVLVYPLIFLVTSVSVFFRPARVAILPRIVPEEDLLSANSAMWLGETIADIVGYPLAAIFVTSLGTLVPLAFWVDAATYLASAALLSTIVYAAATDRTPADTSSPGFRAELQAGWTFLRGETVLLANTLQGAAGQFSLGISIALTPAFVRATYSDTGPGFLTAYGLLETGIGVGNLIGGFVLGVVGSRFGKGRMVIAGYAVWGFLLLLFALTDHLGLAIGLAFGQGVANMVFIIPSQTLFQERTPSELMGRVVGFRFALVFGSMTIALALGSVLGEVVGPGPVIAVFGGVTMIAGLAGYLVPAVRDA